MTYLPDLARCTHGYFSRLTPLRAIGWLEPQFEFRRRTVERAMRDRLEALFSDPWLPTEFLGSHACGLCAQAGGIDRDDADFGSGNVPRGSTNVLIPGRNVVYVVPSLIVHYIDEHQYCPPSIFVDAVRACPPMGSTSYFLALMTVGGDMPAFVHDAAASDAARRAVSLWQDPKAQRVCRLQRSFVTDRLLSGEPLWDERIAAREALRVRGLPRQCVLDVLLRVCNTEHEVQDQDNAFVLRHPDGDIRVCPYDARWVVRRKRGNIWYPFGAASNEAELKRFLSVALGIFE